MKRTIFLALFVIPACKQEHGLEAIPYADPNLTIDQPAPAAWLSQGTVDASGHAENVSNVQLNGADVSIDGVGFTAPVALNRGINVLEATAKDQRGDSKFVRQAVIAGDFADPSEKVQDAAQIRLNQGGIDTALSEVSALLTPTTLAAMIGEMNPVYEDAYGIFGWNAVTVSVWITWVGFNEPQLYADPRVGQLDMDVTIPDLWIGANVSGTIIGISYDVDIEVWADGNITGAMGVGTQAGHLTASLDDVGISLDNFGYDTSLLPGNIEQYILVDTIRGFLEERLTTMVQEQVPALLEQQLSSLDLSFERELLGMDVSVAADFADAYIDDDGIVADVDLDISIPQSGDLSYVGYLAAADGTATPSRFSDVGLSLSDDVLNRLLFEAWRAGVLERRLSTDDGTLPELMLTEMQASTGSVTISSKLPPVVIARDGQLIAQIGELEVDIDTPGGGLGDHLKAVVSAEIPLTITVAEGVLTLDLGEPQLLMSVRESDWGASEETTTRLIEEMLPIDTLLLLLGNFEFPLPAVGPVSIDSADISRESNDVFTGVAIHLGN